MLRNLELTPARASILVAAVIGHRNNVYCQCCYLRRGRCAGIIRSCVTFLFCFWRNSPQWAWASSFTRLLGHTRRRITVGRIPLDE
jgi:hypothetical protein